MKKILFLLAITVLHNFSTKAAPMPQTGEDDSPVKTFTVATLNVDGMPKSITLGSSEINLNPDAKEEAGASAIGMKLKDMGWDVIAVSEDFNYHDNIASEAGDDYGSMTHRGVLSVGNANLLNYLSQKPLFDTDGLGLFYKKDYVTPSQETYTQWVTHNGYTDSGADGLIKKGFRYYLITLADGTELDLYILHMDAETDPADNAARESQLKQLATAIKGTKNKRPILIMGDTNCRYTRDNLKGLLIDAINADPRFTIRDPWIQYGQENCYPALGSGAIMTDAHGYLKGEVVDKVFYINNTESDIRLVAESYKLDVSFVNENNEPLADHWPCVVSFSYHSYNPEIDDVPVIETTNEFVYLRNRGTGKFLKTGGWWGAHAVVGNYGTPMTVKAINGKYDIQSAYGYIGKDAYMDAGGNEDRAIKEWTVYDVDGYHVLSYQDGGSRALTANDPFYFNGNPNYRYVTNAPLNKNDQLQQWEFVSQSELMKEMAKAKPDNQFNATFLLPGANFDRNNSGNSKWALTKAGTQVTQSIGGLDNHENSNFVYEVKTSTPSRYAAARNTWTVSQTIEGLLPGTYTLTFQGFYKEEQQSEQHKVKVTAGEKEVTLANIYEEGAGSNSSLFADNEENKNGIYYPTTTNGVSVYFNAGLYQNKIEGIEVGEDGKLTITVTKTENTKSYTTWTCIDNFQLFYSQSQELIDAIDNLAADKEYTLKADAKNVAVAYTRALSCDWGTLCLPFDYSPTNVEGAVIYKVTGIDTDEEKGVISVDECDEATLIPAFATMLYKRESTEVETLTVCVEDATLKASPADPSKNYDLSNATLCGTTKEMSLNNISESSNSIYYISSDNKFHQALNSLSLRPYRGWFEIEGSAEVKSFVVSDHDNGINTTQEEANSLNTTFAGNETEVVGIYSVNGAKLTNLQKGLNIIRLSDGSVKKSYIK